MNRLAMAIWILPALVALGCGNNDKSERDSLRERNWLKAQMKAKELQQVVGEYHGVLTGSSKNENNVTLKLEIKNVPQDQEGQVDQILIPTLAGYLRFNYGQPGEELISEFVSFSVEKGEYEPKSGKVSLVVANEDYKNLLINLTTSSDKLELKGGWAAPNTSDTGTLDLKRASGSGGGAKISDHALFAIRGDYHGYFFWEEEKVFQRAKLTVTSSVKLPGSLNLRATVRVVFGEPTSTEQTTYTYDDVQFNPLDGQITMRKEGLNVWLVGRFGAPNLDASEGGNSDIRGTWSNRFKGEMGAILFSRFKAPAEPKGYQPISSLAGVYKGELENTNPNSNLPKRIMMNFITSEDLTQPDGISVTGNLRLYFGPFDSTEYVELAFSKIEYNLFTNVLVAQTSGDYRLTVKGRHIGPSVEAKVFHEGLGEIAQTTVHK